MGAVQPDDAPRSDRHPSVWTGVGLELIGTLGRVLRPWFLDEVLFLLEAEKEAVPVQVTPSGTVDNVGSGGRIWSLSTELAFRHRSPLLRTTQTRRRKPHDLTIHAASR